MKALPDPYGATRQIVSSADAFVTAHGVRLAGAQVNELACGQPPVAALDRDVDHLPRKHGDLPCNTVLTKGLAGGEHGPDQLQLSGRSARG